MIPLVNDGAGKGVASKNIVKTAAINDIGQLTICEKAIERLTPSARRKIRRLAISAPELMAWLADNTGLISVSQDTAQPKLQTGEGVNQHIVAGIHNDSRL